MTTRKLSVIIIVAAILLLVFVRGTVYGYLVFNQIENAYVSQSIPKSDGGDVNDDIKIHIVNGATSLLIGTEKLQKVLSYIESRAPIVNYKLLMSEINVSISELEIAKEEYEKLNQKIARLPKNPYFISCLIAFDYSKFFANRNPNESIYQDVVWYLQTGDTDGILKKGLQNVKNILQHLYEIKTAFEEKQLPWRLLYVANDEIYSAVLFGQYTSEIVREIIKE